MILRLLIPALLALPLCAQAPAPSGMPAVHILMQADPSPEGTPALETGPLVKALETFAKEHGLAKAPPGGDEWVLAIRVSSHKGLNGYEVADGILRLSRFEGGKILPDSVKDAQAVACSKEAGDLANRLGESLVSSGWTLLHKAGVLAAAPFQKDGSPSVSTSAATQEKRNAWILYQPTPPPFPPEAKLQRVQGRVLMDVWVGADGVPKSVTVVEGPDPLSAHVKDWPLKWKFHPAEDSGHPVDSHYTINLNFRLQ